MSSQALASLEVTQLGNPFPAPSAGQSGAARSHPPLVTLGVRLTPKTRLGL